jgi:hypothetical protein
MPLMSPYLEGRFPFDGMVTTTVPSTPSLATSLARLLDIAAPAPDHS